MTTSAGSLLRCFLACEKRYTTTTLLVACMVLICLTSSKINASRMHQQRWHLSTLTGAGLPSLNDLHTWTNEDLSINAFVALPEVRILLQDPGNTPAWEARLATLDPADLTREFAVRFGTTLHARTVTPGRHKVERRPWHSSSAGWGALAHPAVDALCSGRKACEGMPVRSLTARWFARISKTLHTTPIGFNANTDIGPMYESFRGGNTVVNAVRAAVLPTTSFQLQLLQWPAPLSHRTSPPHLSISHAPPSQPQWPAPPSHCTSPSHLPLSLLLCRIAPPHLTSHH